MRNYLLGLGVAAGAIASPVMAQDANDARGAYLGFDGGWVLPADFDTDIDAAIEDARTSTESGWGVAAQFGYDWGALRTELEGSYQSFGADEIDSATQGVSTGTGTFTTGPVAYDGDFTLASLMANALLDFGGADDVQFAIGAGVGRTWMNVEATPVGSQFAHLDTDDSEWAWQGLAQLRVPVTDRIDAGLKYRYFSTLEFEVFDEQDRFNDFELRTHTVSAGLVFHLGGREQPLPPPPPVVRTNAPPPVTVTPVPQMPAPPPCNTGPYIVFFDWDESAITPEAARVLNSAISAYGNCGTSSIMLAGHADRSGPASYNVGLSQRRNAAVREYLAARGIGANRITAEAFGESRPRVQTSDGVRELQNRRVEITYGPGSGN